MKLRFISFALVTASLAPTLFADEALFWNRVALDAIKAAGTPPPAAARNLAIASVAQADAVNAISGLSVPYAYNAPALSPTASKEAAVAAAAYNTLKELFPSQRTLIDNAWNQRIGQLGGSSSVTEGLRIGSASASAMLANRHNDGSSTANYVFTGNTQVGQWRPTASGLPGALPGWGNVKGFSLTSGSQFRPTEISGLNTDAYAADYNEVKRYGSKTSSFRTQDQTDTAYFWAGGGGTVTPPGMWNEIASSVALQKGASLDQNVRMLGQLNMALADAGIAGWDFKYAYNVWRPETAIQQGDVDGNPFTAGQTDWVPLLVTPNHPSCVSGHSTFSAAGAAVLGNYFGDNTAFTYASASTNGLTRSFTSFSQAAQEAGMSRIYGGIHFQFDNTYGQTLGAQVAKNVMNNSLQAVPEPASMLAIGLGIVGLAKRRRNQSK